MRVEDFIVGSVALIAVVVWVAVAIAEHIEEKKQKEKDDGNSERS